MMAWSGKQADQNDREYWRQMGIQVEEPETEPEPESPSVQKGLVKLVWAGVAFCCGMALWYLFIWAIVRHWKP